jgi:hypothetical protein
MKTKTKVKAGALNGYAALTLNGTALAGDVSQTEFAG